MHLGTVFVTGSVEASWSSSGTTLRETPQLLQSAAREAERTVRAWASGKRDGRGAGGRTSIQSNAVYLCETWPLF